MKKIYLVLTSFEGHVANTILPTEESERLDALVAAGYLRDVTPYFPAEEKKPRRKAADSE